MSVCLLGGVEAYDVGAEALDHGPLVGDFGFKMLDVA
ncbi:UNVERIFIED_ORG: hypothetical protein ABIB19_000253 [Arthrobacter sp. UYEF10]